jgi:8-amino-7-oxononanoate synthase
VAILAGSKSLVRWFEGKSETRMHCSPPSVAVLHAAEHALAVNQSCGDALRQYLAERVRQFHERLEKTGFSTPDGLFPIQTLGPLPGLDGADLHKRLLELGVRTTISRSHVAQTARISFIISALHAPADIDHAVDLLVQAAASLQASSGAPSWLSVSVSCSAPECDVL